MIITVTIRAKFGSKWQEETALNALNTILTAWELFYNSKHKKNKITVEIL